MLPLLVKRSRERVLVSRLSLRLFAVVHHQRHALPMRIDQHLPNLAILGCGGDKRLEQLCVLPERHLDVCVLERGAAGCVEFWFRANDAGEGAGC